MAICKDGHRISLLVEASPRIGFQTFSKIIKSGSSGICISRLHPDYVAQKYRLDGSKCFWLSSSQGKDVLSPSMLGKIIKVVRSSIAGGGEQVVFMDGLEYLLLYNDLAKVISFLNEVDSLLSRHDGEMVISIDPLTFEPRDLERLFSVFPRCGPEEMMLTLINARPQQTVSAAPESAGQTT